MLESTLKTQWVVLTGAPSSGKTSVRYALQHRGHEVCLEQATAYFEREQAKGRTLDQICADQRLLQQHIFLANLAAEEGHDPQARLFLDRSAVDVIAYSEHYNDGNAPEFRTRALRVRYHRVFQLDPLPFQGNHVRIEDPNVALMLDRQYEAVYRSLGYDVRRVPVMTIEERVAYILTALEE